jgi:branched-chain amino acid transport system substrate-binding protein
MRKRSRFVTVAATAVALSLVMAACGGRDDDSSSGGGGSTDTTAAGGGGEAAFTIDTDNCGTYDATAGVTEDKITFGSSFPQSGTYAAFAKISVGYQAYFEYVNANGGVNGKMIELIAENDEYDPNRTRTNTQELVAEPVFGMFNVVGTPNNLAIRDDLADACVPNLFTATGSQLWGETEDYPWLIGSIPSYATEAAIFAQYLKDNAPTAKVAILAQNDDFGEGYSSAFRGAIDGSEISVVDEQTYNSTDPDVKSQITTLAASGADTILLATTALKCPQALNAIKEQQGWDPLIYISATCTSSTIVGLAPEANVDVLSSIYLQDPADPQWDDNPAMQEFQTLGAQYGISAEDLNNGIVGYGWTMGALLVETLKTSPELTRQAVMEKAYSLSDLEIGLLLPGISINTNGAEDPFPIEQMQIGQYNGQFWALQGDIVSFEGETGDLTG